MSNQDFPDPFFDYKTKGYKIELLGKETKEGILCFKVKLTKKTIKITGIETPNETFYFFDTENYLPVVTEAEIKQGAMKGQKIISKMIDYQEVEGVCFPFALNQFGGDMKVKKNILNPSLEDKEFVFSVK